MIIKNNMFWQPKESINNMTQFINYLNSKYGFKIDSFQKLHYVSIKKNNLFWKS